MKNILIFTLMLVFSFSYAQEQKLNQLSDEERAEMRIDRLDQNLELSDVQKKELKSLLLKKMEANKSLKAEVVEVKKEARQERAERRKMRADKNARRMTMRANYAEQNEEMEAEMKEILTEEQLEKWKVMKAERADKMKEKRALRHENRAQQIRKSRGSNSSADDRSGRRR